MLSIVIARLGKAEDLINAIDNLNDSRVSKDNLQALVKNWPENYDDLLTVAEEYPKANWDRSEAYFLKLKVKKQFNIRLEIWLFYLNFKTTIENIKND